MRWILRSIRRGRIRGCRCRCCGRCAAPSDAVLDDATALRDRVATRGVGVAGAARAGWGSDQESGAHSAVDGHRARVAGGKNLDLVALIGAVQKPGFDKVGAFDLETFFPAKERLELAMAINNLVASPGFAVLDGRRAARCAAVAVHGRRASRAFPSFRLRTSMTRSACSSSRSC